MTAFLPTVERYSAGSVTLTREKYVRPVQRVQVHDDLVSMAAVYETSCDGNYYSL
jgi:hypothetical protein